MPTREILLSLIALLAGVGASSCVEGATCTPADTTHSCCVKNHPQEPEACDGVERMEGATFRIATTNHSTASSGKVLTATTAVAVKTGAEEVLVTMSDAAQAKKLQETLDKVMEECADLAEPTVDSRRPKDEILDSARCNEEVGRDDDGKSVTRAMQLGREKHEEASRCIEERLRKLIKTNTGALRLRLQISLREKQPSHVECLQTRAIPGQHTRADIQEGVRSEAWACRPR